jgi:hypothetical protein
MGVGEIGVIGEGELIIQASFACFVAAVASPVQPQPRREVMADSIPLMPFFHYGVKLIGILMFSLIHSVFSI